MADTFALQENLNVKNAALANGVNITLKQLLSTIIVNLFKLNSNEQKTFN